MTGRFGSGSQADLRQSHMPIRVSVAGRFGSEIQAALNQEYMPIPVSSQAGSGLSGCGRPIRLRDTGRFESGIHAIWIQVSSQAGLGQGGRPIRLRDQGRFESGIHADSGQFAGRFGSACMHLIGLGEDQLRLPLLNAFMGSGLTWEAA
jgi:hypothetical protein